MSGVLIIAEHRQGELQAAALELVTAAADIKNGSKGDVSVAVLATEPEEFVSDLSVIGVDEIVTVKLVVDTFEPDSYEQAVRALIQERKPAVVLIPHTVDAWGYAPCLGASGEYGFASDVFQLRYDSNDLVVTRAAYKEKVYVDLDFPGKETIVLTVRTGTFKPSEGAASPVVNSFTSPDVSARSGHMEFVEPEDTGDVDITQAEIMFSIGRGIDDESNVEQFSELAEQIGATLGCSRPIADNGWLPKSRQVGQSGKTVSNCKLYIANGISGSVQHMAGMKHVENIIAINTDPEASIFTIAKYGIVADMFDIAEELPAHFE